jgi:hypothetical protein
LIATAGGARAVAGSAIQHIFCLTVIVRAAAGRASAARYFEIALPIFKKLGELTDQKGGREARKAKGASKGFTNAERLWLQEVMKTIIRRAAEVAFDPNVSRRQITMDDLPPLASSSSNGCPQRGA